MISPSLKIPENFIRERNKVTEAERETHEEIKLRRTKSGREKARRQEGEKKEKESEERGEARRRTPSWEGSSHPEPPHYTDPPPHYTGVSSALSGLPSLASVSPSMVSETPSALHAPRMNPLLVNEALQLVTDVLEEALPFLLQKTVSFSLSLPPERGV